MKLTRAQREDLCLHEDADIQAYLTAVETGRVGVIYEGGRGASRKPRSDATLRSYLGTLGSLFMHLDATPWADVSERDIEDFLHRPKDDTADRGVKTAEQNLSCIRGFYKYLMAYELVPFRRPDDNPSAFVRIDPERLARPVDRLPVSDEQWLTVLGCSKLIPDNRLWLGLGYYIGLRREEIVTLAPHAIDTEHKRILFVDRKGGKTKSGLEYGHLVHLLCEQRPEVAEGADAWLSLMEMYAKFRRGEDTLVPDMSVRHPGQRLRDQLEHHILPEAGLDSKAFTPHSLRHSFGTNMAMCGLPVEYIADQMSHSTIETTMRYINMAGPIAQFRKRNQPVEDRAIGHGGLRSVPASGY